MAKKITEKNVNSLYNETFTNSAEHGIISQRDFFDHDITNADNINTYYIVENEDFVYNPRISNFAPVGPISRNKLGRNGVMSPLYTVFRTENMNYSFLEQFFRSDGWHSYMRLNGDTGARSDRFSIKDDLFFEMPIPFPPIKEQTAIGTLFATLDNLITCHQREYTSLYTHMVSTNIIFQANTTHTWEQREAKFIFQTVSDKGYPELPVLSATQEFGMVKRTETGINIHHDISNEIGYKRVRKGNFVMHLRSFQGGFAHSAVDGITSPAYTILEFAENKKHNDYFWKHILSSDSFIKRLELITYGIRDGRSISFEDFSTLNFSYPNYNEQTQIAEYFTNLDNLITCHQRKPSQPQEDYNVNRN